MSVKRNKFLFLSLLLGFILSATLVGMVGSLATAAPDPNAGLPPEKQAQKKAEATARAEGLNHPATYAANPKVAPQPNAVERAAREVSVPTTGILEANAPYKASFVVMRNQWTNWANNKLVTVYAGGYTEQAEQGLVAVQEGLPGDNTFSLKEFPTPLKEGKVHIVSVNGSLINLVTDKGSTFVFDLNNRNFK